MRVGMEETFDEDLLAIRLEKGLHHSAGLDAGFLECLAITDLDAVDEIADEDASRREVPVDLGNGEICPLFEKARDPLGVDALITEIEFFGHMFGEFADQGHQIEVALKNAHGPK